MSVTYAPEGDVVGAGGMGGANSLPLWLLLFLGLTRNGDGVFGGGGNAGAGVLAGETQAKLDCLQQGHNAIQAQIAEQTTGQRFAILNGQLNATQDIQREATLELAGIQRDSTAAITNTLNDIRAEAARCCCENQIGQQEIKTAIAMQTNELLVNGNQNTQRIIDQLAANTLAACQQDNDRLRSELNEQRILAAIASSCGGNGPGNSVANSK